MTGEYRQIWCCLQVTLCDPYLSALEAFAWTRYTNRRLLYFTFSCVNENQSCGSRNQNLGSSS